MPLTLRNNISSLLTRNNVMRIRSARERSFARVSTGRRLNQAADDASAMAISVALQAQARSHAVAGRNAGRALGMAKTAESALGQMGGVVGRMRELAVQSANADLDETARGFLDEEFQSLATEMNRLSEVTTFNGTDLLRGPATTIAFQVGIDTSSADTLAFDFGGASFDLFALGDTTGGTVNEVSNIGGAVTARDVGGSVNVASNFGSDVTANGVTGAVTANSNVNSTIDVETITGSFSATSNANSTIFAHTVTGTVNVIGNSSSTLELTNIAGTVNISSNAGANISVSNVAADATVSIVFNGGGSYTFSYVAGESIDHTSAGPVTYRGTGGTVGLLSIDGVDGQSARSTIGRLDAILTEINDARASYGASINRLEIGYENTQAQRLAALSAESALADANLATETASLARSEVLLQAGLAVLAQANQSPELVLSLIR
ncbi:MAG: flagellin [Myxococcota bacterium]